MLSSAAITAHSPILLNAADPQTSRYDAETFGALAKHLKKTGIHHVVSVSAHPSFARQGFSAYVENEFELQFPEFGDLITHESLKPAWSVYHFLRERGLAFDPINAKRLDYGHGVPLLALQKHLQKYEIEVLCINDDLRASEQQQFAFGQELGALLHEHAAPIFVLCSGDLCLPAQKKQESACRAFNQDYLVYLNEALTSDGKTKLIPPELVAPCLHGPLQILRGILEQMPKRTYQELCAMECGPVALYSALIQRQAR